MKIMYCVYKRVKDNIPGFRNTDVDKIKCFDSQKEAEVLLKELNEKEAGSEYHPGYGAGSGTINTTFYIQEELISE